MKTEIELTLHAKSLICRAERQIVAGSPWRENLQRAVETLKHTTSTSIEDYNFALAVLRTTIEDAETKR